MAHDKILAKQKLTQLWENEQVKVLDTNGKKYAMMSDIHLGDGGKADNFHENEQALDAALQHYLANNYELIGCNSQKLVKNLKSSLKTLKICYIE